MEKTDKQSLQSIKVAASQTLKTRVVKSKKKYVRNEKHKAGRYSDEHLPLFLCPSQARLQARSIEMMLVN